MSSVEQYPDYFYVLVADTSPLELGRYTGINTGDLQTAHLRIYNKNASSFSYGLSLIVSSSEGGPALATSETITFSDTAIGQTTANFLCDLTFTFTDFAVTTAETYYLRLALTGYTRTSNTTYLGVWCDWYEPLGTSNTGGARIQFGVMR